MSIPKPLVQLNQIFILLTVLSGLLLSPYILILPLIIGVITLATKSNPVILFGKRFLKKTMKDYPQEDKAQQLFNQWIATVCIGLSILFFSIHISWAAYLFGIMVILASGLALAGYCIGCTIRYRYIMWKYKKGTRGQA
ncbi:hypothetical protein JCM21714_3092 [Gracilibacillus boraciitolerans JCM 21714]|uniref:DUF4395 domain-containing protein n=1 Tax=Gracilibacillus boraciitolerans JCM 21714 TaxID=1298598 RepID=W4VKS3_9BACI|nr:DUF4395 domain-containing protein [Gracilibacillus boraciitolerans]GAE93970.1 hypothetical protein JCM21714_3092 [Gracilibacillus boraciitolerans JCM 21714]